jgi:hypothetical protein
MKTQIKIGIGVFRESIQWIFRFLLLGAVLFLVIRIYKVNPFFVQITGSVLFLMAILMPDYYFIVKDDYFISKKVTCFGLLTFRRKFRLNDIKEIVIYGHFNRATNLSDYLIPYMNHNYSNQLRLIMNDGDVNTLYTMIYIDDLEDFGRLFSKAIDDRSKYRNFKHPIEREL